MGSFFKYGNEWNEYIVNEVVERCNGSYVLDGYVLLVLLEEKLSVMQAMLAGTPNGVKTKAIAFF